MDDTDLINKIGRKRYRRRLERDRYFTQAIDPSQLRSPSPPTTATFTANMATTAGGNKLAQEIHDEFLTCKICLEGFTQPKCLECLHTFCEGCIESHVLNECSYKKYSDYREFTCPLCRKRTSLPVGGVKKLPDNFLVASLSEVVARQKPGKFPYCDICKLVHKRCREACSKCLDCNKLLCTSCVTMHKETKVTMNHSLFDVEIEKDIQCRIHEDEVVRYYCETCQTCICVLCTFTDCKDHEITQFNDAVFKYKEHIGDLLSSCKGKIDVYDRQLALLNKCETVIECAEQKIRDTAVAYIAEIRSKEKTLIEELHSMYGTELMELVKRKNEMQNNLDGLKSTCNLTEMVLKGKDIELLLLKKQVQEKLSMMAGVELTDLPRSIGKQVEFVSGNMNMGHLEDVNQPLDKKGNRRITGEPVVNKFTNMTFRRKKDFDDSDEEIDTTQQETAAPAVKVEQCTQETQTDKVITEKAVKTVGRCIQTEFYIPEAGSHQAWKEPSTSRDSS